MPVYKLVTFIYQFNYIGISDVVKMNLTKLLEPKAMYLQQTFVTDDMVVSQLMHTLERRNLHNKESQDLFMCY